MAVVVIVVLGCWYFALLPKCLLPPFLELLVCYTLQANHAPLHFPRPHTCRRAAQGLGVQPVAFLRLPSFALYWLLKRMAGSPRARERLWSQQYTDNGTTVADHTIAILLGLVGGACV